MNRFSPLLPVPLLLIEGYVAGWTHVFATLIGCLLAYATIKLIEGRP